MEWLPFHPSELQASWRGTARRGRCPRPDPSPSTSRIRWGREEPTALDLSLVEVVYEVLAMETRCSRCGAPLGRRLRVLAWPTILRSVQWRVGVRTRCRGWRRHRHTAAVGRSSCDMVLGPFGDG